MTEQLVAFLRSTVLMEAIFNEGSSASALAYMSQLGCIELVTNESELNFISEVLKEEKASEELLQSLEKICKRMKLTIQPHPGEDSFSLAKSQFRDASEPDDIALLAATIEAKASLILSDRTTEWYPEETNRPILPELRPDELFAKGFIRVAMPSSQLMGQGTYLFIQEDRLAYGPNKAWKSLKPDEYVMTLTTLTGEHHKSILDRLEQIGFCLLRFQGQSPHKNQLESIEQWLGPAIENQNGYLGKIKEIQPKEAVAANTGDSAKELSFHTDGTQQPVFPPAFLVFQYHTAPSYGGLSSFLDLTQVILEMPVGERQEILVALASHDAAICKKKGLQYEGPLVVPVCSDLSLSFRLRFDDVISINPKYQQAFNKLKQRILRATNYLGFQPNEGDIVIFDNWRVMHGRGALDGTRHLRFHSRMWIHDLAPRHKTEGRLHGVRGLSQEELNAIASAGKQARR